MPAFILMLTLYSCARWLTVSTVQKMPLPLGHLRAFPMHASARWIMLTHAPRRLGTPEVPDISNTLAARIAASRLTAAVLQTTTPLPTTCLKDRGRTSMMGNGRSRGVCRPSRCRRAARCSWPHALQAVVDPQRYAKGWMRLRAAPFTCQRTRCDAISAGFRLTAVLRARLVVRARVRARALAGTASLGTKLGTLF